MSATSIEWCDHSINPIRAKHVPTGKIGHYCEKIAAGCANCYSSELQRRFGAPTFGSGQKRSEFELFLDETKLDEVRRRKKPTKYFWCDMTDFFGDWMQPEWLQACFATMDATPQHTHLLLTKRPENVLRMWPQTPGIPATCVKDGDYKWERATQLMFRPNVWLGTSISDQATADANIPELLRLRDLCPVLFVSAEPLLGPVNLCDLEREREDEQGFDWLYPGAINWLIIGGESGPHARPCDPAWIRSLVAQCQAAEVSCFVKQLGSAPYEERAADDHLPAYAREAARKYGIGPLVTEVTEYRLRDRKGGDPAEWPEDLRMREFPTISEVDCGD
jgi:protein gp37